MRIEKRRKGFISLSAHPIGCRANVADQIGYAKGQGPIDGPDRVLVIGASTGYGLAARIASTFASNAATIGVALEKGASGNRTATPGWYNTAAFEEFALAEGRFARSIIGDAFSTGVKEQTADAIRETLGKVNLVVYSLAAPRRTTADGVTHASVLKPIGSGFTNKTLDLDRNQVRMITMPPASEDEIADTVTVMGGDDWRDWIRALSDAGVLDKGTVTYALSYIGPELTHPIYRNGTIGMAKDHLYRTSLELNGILSPLGGNAYISVNKALVTQASSAIPIVPLYISILYGVMKRKGLHEDCIGQMLRLHGEKLFSGPPETDDGGMLRLDDLELREDVQDEVQRLWEMVDSDNLFSVADVDGFWRDYDRAFGFGLPGIDYDADVEADVPIPSLNR